MMKTPALIAGAAAIVPILSDSALKSAALLLFVAAVAGFLRKASAATRHSIWIVAMVGLLALPILSFTLPKWSALPASFNLAADTIATEPAILPTLAPTPPTMGVSAPIVSGTANGTTPPFSWNVVLVLLWSAGAGLLLLRLLLSHWLLQTLARSSRVEPALQARFDRTRQSLEIGGDISLRVSSESSMPKTFGFFRPCVVLPAEAIHWTPSRLQAVLAHELGHIKRRDPVTQLLVQIVCALYWFNPLVWLAARQIESERERACDDLVLNHGVKASDYAQHLLAVVTGCRDDRLTAGASVGMARPSRLEGRVVSILDERVNRRSLTKALLVATLAATAVAIVPLAMVEARAQTPPDPVAANESAPPQPEPAQPANIAVANENVIDRLVRQRLEQEGIEPTQLEHPEKLTPSQRHNLIRSFYRIFLKRNPSVDELKAAEANWTQADYYRWAESLAGRTFPTPSRQPSPIKPSKIAGDPASSKREALPTPAAVVPPQFTPATRTSSPTTIVSAKPRRPKPQPRTATMLSSPTFIDSSGDGITEPGGTLPSRTLLSNEPETVTKVHETRPIQARPVLESTIPHNSKRAKKELLSPIPPRTLPTTVAVPAPTALPSPTFIDSPGNGAKAPRDTLPQTTRQAAPVWLDEPVEVAKAIPARPAPLHPVLESTSPPDSKQAKKELASHWRDLVSAREQIRKTVEKRHRTGLASASALNHADQALTESRIGLAKATDNEQQIVTYLNELIALRKQRLQRQHVLAQQGLVSENDLLQAREKLIEARIRLAEAALGKK